MVFEDAASRTVDGGVHLGDTTVQPCTVTYHDVDDFQDPMDLEEEETKETVSYHVLEPGGIRDLIGEDDASDITLYYVSKIGGWPGWDQYPEWPSCPHGDQMAFVAQLDAEIGADCGWGGGGHAYLFVCHDGCPERHGELVIQNT